MEKATIPTQVSLANILYATDFSRHSSAALPYALSIARRYESTMWVAHIISLFPMANSSPTLAMQEIAAQSVRETKDAMANLEPALLGIPHSMLIRRGDISKELSAIVSERKIDLMVLGTRGRTGASKVVMGSVAEKIFRQAQCPVLTVGPHVCGEADAIADTRSILCPIDFSPESLAAVPYGISLAQENRARLYLLHVTEGPLDKMTESNLKARLLDLLPQDPELWCAPKALVHSGAPAETITATVEEMALDLVVLGVKGVARLAGASTHLAMATAYKVITEALCPVLTVRA
jgi:nucleotide-binding universal stress UspA family protein